MAAFYIDNCLSPKIADELQHRQHQAAATRHRQLGRAGDHEQLLTAYQNREILVTGNLRDFLLLHDAWCLWLSAFVTPSPPSHLGILVVPQQYWDPATAAHELALFVTSGRVLTNRVYRYRRGHGWEQLR
ncbi:MAG TPA: DUF5615 family PIN-like protein [Chloroflexota bacterium]|nr:DUF5615 family PIN-like protein [Chloroflexota bacterium]